MRDYLETVKEHYSKNGILSLALAGYRHLYRFFGKKTPLIEAYANLVGFPMRLLLDSRRDIYRRQPEVNLQEITILGRGPSLCAIERAVGDNNILIVNDFTEELNDPNIQSCLDNAEKIFMMGHHREPVLPRKKVLKYNIVWYQIRNLPPNSCDNWYCKRRIDYRPERVGLSTEYLPEEVESRINDDFRKNTGLLAILYACHVFSPEKMKLIGFDFYEDSDYFFGDVSDSVANSWERNDKTAKLMATMKNTMKQFSDVKFQIITSSSFSPEISNSEILRVNP